MSDDVRDELAAVLRLAEGADLRDAVDGANPGAWIALDLDARSWLRWHRTWEPEGTQRRRRWFAALRHPDTLDESRLALALCHRDGRVREAAVERVPSFPALLPLVVVRAADWVEPVREKAREVLRGMLTVADAVALAPLILLVGRRARGVYGVGLLGEALGGASLERLDPLLTAQDRAVRRYAHRLAVANGLFSPTELARVAAHDDDTVLQDLCADAALAAVARDGVDEDVLEPLLGARNPRARAAGVTALRRAGLPEGAVEFLGDRSGRVRACARYVVRQYAGDPAAWYRERCAGPGVTPGAVSGLAECGERGDAEVLWGLTSHSVPAVRARAVAGLRALDVSDVARFTELLDDPDPGVVREATLALVPSARALDAGWLMERLADRRSRAVRVSAFRLLDRHGGIVRLRAAVALIDDPDEKLRHWARQSVQRWHPTADVPLGSAEVGELYDRARELFSEYVLTRRKREAGLGS
ncbi:hypothetical protein OG885_32180 [Streptomyces sp. NBC_00028]|uniref:hypothetical protein n=1 Tax=Streptomyces sp. NBC_00028 TaxID=2975624 RepID=UPI00325578E2